MMLAALLLLSPFPSLGNVDFPVSNPPAIVDDVPNTTSPKATSKESTAINTSTSTPLLDVSVPSMPQPQANSEADASFAVPALPEPQPFAFQPVKPAIRHGYIT